MSQLTIIDVQRNSPYELTELLRHIKATFLKGKQQLSGIVQQMKSKLSSDCERENLRLLFELPSMKMSSSGVGGDGAMGRLAALPMSYSERAQMRKHCRNVAKVLRVLDLLMRDTLYQLVDDNLSALLNLLNHTRDHAHATSVIYLHVRFLVTQGEGNAMSIEPSKGEVLEGLRSQLLDVLEFGVCIHSLVKEKAFAEVLMPIVEEVLDIVSENMLDRIYGDRENSLFQAIAAIGDLTESDFDTAQLCVDHREYICQRYAEYDRLTVELSVEFVRQMKKEAIEDVLQRLDDDMGDCGEIPDSLKVGTMKLMLKDMKAIYWEKLSSFHSRIHQVIQQVYLREGERLYSTLFNYKTIFDDDIPHLDGFVEVLIKFNECTQQLPQLEQSYKFILALREIIKQFRIESTEEMTELSNTVSTIWFSFQKTCSQFNDALDGNRKYFMRELSTRSLVLAPLVAECKKYAQSSILDSPATDEHEALSEIMRAEEVMAKILAISTGIVYYQEIMKVYVFEYDEMLVLKERIASMLTVWRVVEETKALKQQYLRSPWNTVNVDSLDDSFREYLQTMRHISRVEVIPSTQLFLKEMIHRLQESLKLFRMLQGPTLMQRHRDAKEGTVDLKVFSSEEPLSVSEILNSNIESKIDLVVEIHERSKKEANLAFQSDLLRSKCEALRVDIIQDKQLLSISNFPRLIEVLHDVEIDIQIALKSAHVKYSRDAFLLLKENTALWQSQLKCLVRLQQEFLKIRALFTR